MNDKEVERQVETILRKLSLEEKIGQLDQVGVADFAPGQ